MLDRAFLHQYSFFYFSFQESSSRLLESRLGDIFRAVRITSKMIEKDGAANPEAAGSSIKLRTIIAALILVASFTAQNVTLVKAVRNNEMMN